MEELKRSSDFEPENRKLKYLHLSAYVKRTVQVVLTEEKMSVDGSGKAWYNALRYVCMIVFLLINSCPYLEQEECQEERTIKDPGHSGECTVQEESSVGDAKRTQGNSTGQYR